MSDNYQEETQPLFKLLRNEAFRFIIVRYNHYSLVQQLQKDLQQRFPDRPVNTFNAKTVDYHQLTQAYYDLGSGFFFIENFDDLLKEDKNSLGQETPETAQNNERRRHITAGLNLRRDKLAKYPIALIVFIGFSADSLYAKKIMEKMPDLWSFRSLLLDLEMPLANDQPDWQNQQTEITNRSLERPISSLGGTDKQAELNRLLELLAATPKNETAFRQTLYPQIADLQNDLGDYQAAIDTLQTWGKIVNDDEKSQIWFKMGDIYTQLGDLDKALTLFQTYHKLQKELFTSDPTNIHFKNGLAISYSKTRRNTRRLRQSQSGLAVLPRL
ncbi:hypothetical protein CRENPOLYSF2_560013 [Crenothrix polyspora]|uniref:Uncharacterized protein n=1 Tax=Crenothrix polyspora TaxID=360316 RepID=A0A1R4HGS8_9GAMM|nr:hypothetical protein [Crenothrix polyspora]SJM95433.1 hypothetical protein CRENPOLYSF2_560013 [Crenothrix polyspora]